MPAAGAQVPAAFEQAFGEHPTPPFALSCTGYIAHACRHDRRCQPRSSMISLACRLQSQGPARQGVRHRRQPRLYGGALLLSLLCDAGGRGLWQRVLHSRRGGCNQDLCTRAHRHPVHAAAQRHLRPLGAPLHASVRLLQGVCCAEARWACSRNVSQPRNAVLHKHLRCRASTRWCVQDAAQQDPSEQTKAHAAGVALKPILQWLDKSTCVVVGPGLGTDSIMCDTATRALRAARERVRLTTAYALTRAAVFHRQNVTHVACTQG